MIRILVVEDEEITRKYLVGLLDGLDTKIEIIDVPTAEEALKVIEHQTIDLFFLDIELPGLSGLELAYKLRKIPQYKFTYIVFITTYVQKILESFKAIHCYDFIIKPFKDESVIRIAQELLEGICFSRKSKREDPKEPPYVLLDFRKYTFKIFLDEILFIEVQRRDCRIHTRKQIYTIPNITLKKIASMLPENNFIQSHRAYLINPNQVSFVEKTKEVIYFKDYDQEALLGRKFKSLVIDKLGLSLY